MVDLLRVSPSRPGLDGNAEREHRPRQAGRSIRASYVFLHNRGSASPDRFGPGSLYLLPPSSFVADKPLAGAIDTAHLVSHEPVRPLARLDVTPDDFPFRDRVGYYRDGEPNWVSLLRA